jgi:putative ATPase
VQSHATDDLFERAWQRDPSLVPLAERMRPQRLDEVAGQTHLLGPGKILRRIADTGRVPSLIFWGPPGVGKTTLARLLAEHTKSAFVVLSATSAGVKELREAIEGARRRRAHEGRGTLLFVDEIHRFNKGQQDILLPHIEAGVCSLIGATTENPSFEVNAALLSRVRVLQLKSLELRELVALLRRALTDEERGLGARKIEAEDGLLAAIAHTAQGDARRALGALELAVDLVPDGEHALTREIAQQAVGGRSLRYDKAGEEHYNVVSAFIKSMRASDADAAVYWLARMLEAGEDVDFVARRIVIFAAEDVGNAEPAALQVAVAAAQASHQIGMPEAVLPLTQATVFLALAPKSNTALTAYAAARKEVMRSGSLEVPLAVRNAVTSLMREAQYGVGYKYPHDFEGGVAPGHESYLPEPLRGQAFVKPGPRGWEAAAWARLQAARGKVLAQETGPEGQDAGDRSEGAGPEGQSA